jgi:hypothetical protein
MIGWYDEHDTDQPEKWIGKHTLWGPSLFPKWNCFMCFDTGRTNRTSTRASEFVLRAYVGGLR